MYVCQFSNIFASASAFDFRTCDLSVTSVTSAPIKVPPKITFKIKLIISI